MAKRPVPTHPEGWKFCGGDGAYLVWRAGPNDYKVTKDDKVVVERQHFGEAFSKATSLRAVDDYYADRNASGQAALTAHR